MNKILLSFILLTILSVQTSPQTTDPRQIDAFPRIPCGDFMARMDALLGEWLRDTSQRIFVVYYGHRFRKTTRLDKMGRPETLVLELAHRDDGLNWAKGVPRFLQARVKEIGAERAPELTGLPEKVVLVDGGFREDIGVELWIGSANAAAPKPTPTISEKDISFRVDRPFPVPNHITCYSGY